MKTIALIASSFALAGTLLPALLFFGDQIPLASAKNWMLISAVVWFISAPFWIRSHDKAKSL